MANRSCPVCGQQNEQVLFRPKASPGPISRCLNCDMVYVANIDDDHALIFDGPVVFDRLDSNILTSSDLNDVKDSWEFGLLPDKEAEQPALRQNALKVLRRIEGYIDTPPQETKILDFGSGWGFFLSTAKEHDWITFGLEPLPASAVYARATFGLDITTDTLREDTFSENFFNVIVSFQVFEHLPDPKQNIRYLHKMLQPGGIILIEVPNFQTWTMRLLRSRHRHFVQDHLNFFSFNTLERLLVENGFEIIDRYHTERLMSVRHLVQSWLRRYLPRRVTDILQNWLEKNGLWGRTIGLNIRDIITVVAYKQKH